MGGKLGLSNGLDTGFGVATLAVGVAVDSGACVIVVACVGATPSLSPVLAASKKGTTGGGCSDSVPAAKFCAPAQRPREGVCQFPERVLVRLTQPAVPVVHPLESSSEWTHPTPSQVAGIK